MDKEGKPQHIEINQKLRSMDAIRLAIIEAIPDAMLTINREGIIIYVNHTLETLFGYTQEELIGKQMEILLPVAYRERHPAHRDKYFNAPKIRPMGSGMELLGQHKNGTTFSAEISLSPLITPEGQYAIAVIRDVTQRVQQTKKLKEKEKELEHINEALKIEKNSLLQINRKIILITEFSETLIACKSQKEIVQVIHSYVPEILNFCDGALYLLDYTQKELELKTSWGNHPRFQKRFFSDECWGMRQGILHEKKASRAGIQCEHLRHFKTGKNYICIPISAQNKLFGLVTLKINDENELPSKRHTLIRMVCKTVALSIANVNLQILLKEQSLRDSLTGLHNRRFFNDYLMKQIFYAERQKLSLAIFLFDIDNFKQINDTYGHDVGDIILEQVGKTMMKLTRAEDAVCRYGGEEFICILSNSTAQLSKEIGEKIRIAISTMFPDPFPPSVTISGGISIYPQDATMVKELIEAADKAMYQAKKAGKNQVLLFSDIKKHF